MPAARAVVVTRHGPPEVLAIREIDVPDPTGDGVLIRAAASGVNFADVFARLGFYDAAPPPPFVPGFEAAGVVEAVGPGVTDLRPGDRVVALTRFRGYASRVCAPRWLCLRLPPGASFEEGAGFPTVHATAYHALHNLGHLAGGMTVLIHAAAGGVGIAALQLARRLSVTIIGTVGSTAKIEVARANGAHHVIDYVRDDFEAAVREITKGRGVDLALDSVGGDCFTKSYRLLAPMGHLVFFGAATLMPPAGLLGRLRQARDYLMRPRIDPLKLMPENRTISGFNLVYLVNDPGKAGEALGSLERFWHEGTLRPVVGRVFPAEQAGEAQEALRSRATVGKVILTWTASESPRSPRPGSLA